MRTYTTVDRLLTILEALAPDRPEVKFVVERGSEFANGLPGYLRELGFEVLGWKRAKRTRFDVVLAAHATAALGELKGPVIVCPHGAGLNRIVPPSTGSDTVATGLVESQLVTRWGRVVASVIFVSHDEQHERMRVSAPKAAARAIVLGDPVFDRIVASAGRRERYRKIFGVRPGQKLVVVTSTWGPRGTFGCQADLPKRLLAQLPADRYKVLSILHPNIWAGHSPAEIKRIVLRDGLDSGLVIVPPRTPWEAGLIAADLVIGDHSSLSIYAASLGRRFLLAADGRAELVPGTPLAQLCAEAPRLDPDGDLLEQIELHLATAPRFSPSEIADTVFQQRGESWQIFRSVVRRTAGLPEAPGPPRMTAVDDPRPEHGREVTTWLVSATSTGEAGEPPSVGISRYPRIVRDHVQDHEDIWQVADYEEADETLLRNSEIIVRSEVLGKADGERWLVAMNPPPPAYRYNAAVLAYRHVGGCAVQWRHGPRVEAATEDVFAAAVVLYRLWQDGWPLDKPGSVGYDFGAGEPKTFCFSPLPL